MSYFPNQNDMSGVVNRAGTPAINPNASDPRAALQALLANNGAVPSAPAPSGLQSILQAVAQAGAVGLSNDPGQALGQQVAQQRDQQAKAKQMEDARNFEIQMQNRQVAIQDLQNQIAEGRTIEAENRSESRQIKKEDRDYKKMIEDEDRKYGYDVKITDLKDKNELNTRTKLAEIEIAGKEKLQREHNVFLQKMDELKTQDKQLGDTLELAATYGTYGMSDDQAYEIAGKRRRGEKLTPAESNAVSKVNAQIERERKLKLDYSRPRSSGGGSGSSNNLNEKFINGMMTKMLQEDYALLNDGVTVVDIKSIPKDLNGQPIGMKRQLSAEESYRYVADRIIPIAASMKNQAIGSGATTVQQQVPTLDKTTNAYIEQFKSVLNPQDDSTYNAVLEGAKRLIQENPGDREAIQNALIKTGVVSSTKFQSKKFVPNKATRLVPEEPTTPSMIRK